MSHMAVLSVIFPVQPMCQDGLIKIPADMKPSSFRNEARFPDREPSELSNTEDVFLHPGWFYGNCHNECPIKDENIALPLGRHIFNMTNEINRLTGRNTPHRGISVSLGNLLQSHSRQKENKTLLALNCLKTYRYFFKTCQRMRYMSKGQECKCGGEYYLSDFEKLIQRVDDTADFEV